MISLYMMHVPNALPMIHVSMMHVSRMHVSMMHISMILDPDMYVHDSRMYDACIYDQMSNLLHRDIFQNMEIHLKKCVNHDIFSP